MLHNDSFNRREYVVQVLLKVVDGYTVGEEGGGGKLPARLVGCVFARLSILDLAIICKAVCSRAFQEALRADRFEPQRTVRVVDAQEGLNLACETDGLHLLVDHCPSRHSQSRDGVRRQPCVGGPRPGAWLSSVFVAR